MPPNRTSERHAGRVALVTGAARGVGQAIAAGVAERGTRIVLGDIDDVSEASDLNGQRRTLHTVRPATREDKGAAGKGAVGGE
jgi:NAD(P)-dependent dehydrogenase (short-subunit alcohol dehydrogenase family)